MREQIEVWLAEMLEVPLGEVPEEVLARCRRIGILLCRVNDCPGEVRSRQLVALIADDYLQAKKEREKEIRVMKAASLHPTNACRTRP